MVVARFSSNWRASNIVINPTSTPANHAQAKRLMADTNKAGFNAP